MQIASDDVLFIFIQLLDKTKSRLNLFLGIIEYMKKPLYLQISEGEIGFYF